MALNPFLQDEVDHSVSSLAKLSPYQHVLALFERLQPELEMMNPESPLEARDSLLRLLARVGVAKPRWVPNADDPDRPPSVRPNYRRIHRLPLKRR